MKKALLCFLGMAFLCLMAAEASATNNHNAKWALHYAGAHSAKANKCETNIVADCTTDLTVTGTGTGKIDIYIYALDTDGIAGTRYGLCCSGTATTPYFYGWTNCADLEIPTAGWANGYTGCAEGNAQTWTIEQPAGHVTIGILYVYVYGDGTTKFCICDDPRKGFAEWCDGTAPDPICVQHNTTEHANAFGCVGLNGETGYNPCNEVAVEQSSWGAVKSLYQ